jgi:hypothetical protein
MSLNEKLHFSRLPCSKKKIVCSSKMCYRTKLWSVIVNVSSFDPISDVCSAGMLVLIDGKR